MFSSLFFYFLGDVKIQTYVYTFLTPAGTCWYLLVRSYDDIVGLLVKVIVIDLDLASSEKTIFQQDVRCRSVDVDLLNDFF